MRQSLNNRESNTQNDVLLDALTRAIGNFSSLTPATNAALIDIANSKLIEYLVPIFGSELDKRNALAIVEYVHQSRGASNVKESSDFAEVLGTCLKTAHDMSVEQESKDAPASIRAEFRKRRDDEARRADGTLNSVVQKLQTKDGDWIDNSDVSAAFIARRIKEDSDPLKNFVRALKRTVDSVDVHGSSGDVVQVSLDDIYVDMPVSYIDRKRNFNPYQDLRKNISRHRVSDDWSGTLELIGNTVLLGDPGGGKSTLSKKLCLECCDRYLKGQTKLPIYIQLRTYISNAVEDDRLSLRNYIVDSVTSTVIDADQRDLTSSVLYHLRIGAVFFVADGLDEVLTPSNRARVVQEIASFRKEFPLCQILVTSRYVGYETQPLDGFTHLGVDYLSDSAIEKIYRNVSRTVLKRPDGEVNSRLQGFLLDARKKASELIRSPLLLTLIVIIYDKKSEIPDNRASLYAFCADLLFDQWDKYRDITPDLPERYRLFDLFKHLSALLYENEEYGGTIGRDDLQREARDFFRSDYVDNREGRAAAAAEHMVGHLTGRAWILHEVGENIFEFTHRTFLEYFYAKYLDTEFEETGALVRNCLMHVVEGQRSLPTHLALQIRTNNKRAASTKVAEALTESLRDRPSCTELVDFCLDSLGYLLPNGDQLSEFVSVLAKPAIFSSDPSGPLRLLCTSSPLRNNILNICTEQLDQVETVSQLAVLEVAFRKMRRDSTFEMISANGEVVDVVHRTLERLYSKQATSPYVCKLAFDLDCRVNWSAVERFGLRLWGNKLAGFGQSVRILSDSREMLRDASRFIIGSDAKSGKSYKLARAIASGLMRLEGGLHLDTYHVGRDLLEASSLDISFSADRSAWREDRSALEVYAFSLILCAETHMDFLDAPLRERFIATISDVCDALDNVGSDQSIYCRSWLKEETTLILHPSLLRLRGRKLGVAGG
ncbi:hypothetical protein DDE23_13305 [Pararhodobacter aggregans]|uniref:NACHT domain-containing protein n=2 Tax=Pararhodobacter aggregans TaxID=404875 RepID=A0A2T7URL6_9RHOB|nr:hypothetical protein DDE23_13305 [Pararhodobacter aggregans]